MLVNAMAPLAMSALLLCLFFGHREPASQSGFLPRQFPSVREGRDFVLPELGIKLIWCPPGDFIMGGTDITEEPPHPVTLSQGFWLGETEITQAQYEKVVGENPSGFPHAGPNAPVECVDWYDAVAYGKTLTKLYQHILPEGYVFGLPTEAQWAHACRAQLPYGIEIYDPPGPLNQEGDYMAPLLDELGWYSGNSGVTYPGGCPSYFWVPSNHPSETAGTHPVAQKKPNPWGFYDMLGNVSEWCFDIHCYRYLSGHQVDPEGPLVTGEGRVYRGGAWYDRCTACRVFDRSHDHPNFWSFAVGFRLALRPITRTGHDGMPKKEGHAGRSPLNRE